MADDPDRLPSWVTWEQRPFSDANLLLLPGRNPALVDSGFVGHACQTADWMHARTSQLSPVVNTHWHANHVGGNAILQARGPGSLSASLTPTRAHSGPPVPVAATTLAAPHHRRCPVRLRRRLGQHRTRRTRCRRDRTRIPATPIRPVPTRAAPGARTDPRRHGVRADRRATPRPATRRRPRRGGLYAARRIFAYALMIRGGIAAAQIEPYLHQRAWLTDAARLLDRAPDALAAELVESMLRSGSIVVRQGRIHANAKHTPVTPGSLHVPFPRAWPVPAPRRA